MFFLTNFGRITFFSMVENTLDVSSFQHQTLRENFGNMDVAMPIYLATHQQQHSRIKYLNSQFLDMSYNGLDALQMVGDLATWTLFPSYIAKL